MKVFIIILLLAIVVCKSAQYSTPDNSQTANQIVRTTEETAHAEPAGTGCSCPDPAVKSSYNVTLTPACLIPFVGNAACNAACINAGATGGFCDVKFDCMCYKTG